MDKHKEKTPRPTFNTVKSEPEEVVEEKVIEVEAEKIKFGKVVDCACLNVRKFPNVKSDVVVLINDETDLKILDNFKNDEWYKIVTFTGDEGYVMKQYVAVKE